MSPTARTLKLLRDQGYFAQVVEHWNPHVHRRVDLFGVIDVVAVSGDVQGVLGVQTTSGDHVSHRLAKMRQNAAVEAWLQAGNRLVVHGWKKYKKPVDRKYWQCREEVVTLDHVRVEVPW